jgi:hypothetical protein
MLKLSANRRFLATEDDRPFFYLGDTAWTLFQRLDRPEADIYLQDRAAKGFTVIQAVALSEFEGLSVPNPYGDLPLEGGDPARPNDAYFRHVDYIVDRAEALGLYIGLLPTWGDKVGPALWGAGPEVFTPENAHHYGRFLGRRYRDRPIIWILGGDRNPAHERHVAIWRALAEGLDQGDGGQHLMTFHPQGEASSSSFVHDEPWLDFNMLQSGHAARNVANYEAIMQDYNRIPVKPCMDGEACYEDHPVDWQPENGYFEAYDVRKTAYWALFAGAHGHTYGANGVFQFWRAGQPDRFSARLPWQEALQLPGAAQMQHARKLLESHPFFERIPDQSLLASDADVGTEHVQATRAQDGSYAFIYTAAGRPVTVDLRKLSGKTIVARWYDPRQGTYQPQGDFATGGLQEFRPPSGGTGNDWVLVLDDAARTFAVE